MESHHRDAVYLYCLGRSGLLPDLEGIGVDGNNPLFLHSFQGLGAVLSTVPLAEFCGAAAEERLQDLTWVGPRACRHEEVVEQAARYSPLLPARFGTIFSSLDGVEALLKTHHDPILKFLDQVTDKEEWSVKGLLDRAKVKEQLFSAQRANEADRLASLSPGMRYFQEQHIRSKVEKELNGWLKGVCQEVSAHLGRHAAVSCERKVLSREVTGMDRDMVLNWAFLVPRKAVADFRTRIEQANAEHDRQGLVFQLSGPWPPYSFCPALELA
jgi:hypothetical protein